MKNSSPYPFLVSLALLIIVFFVTSSLIYEDYKLSKQGEEAVATVERLKYTNITKQGRQTYYHEITFDGHTSTLSLESQHPSGTQIQVTYLPLEPETVKPGKLKNKSTIDIITGSIAMLGYLLCFVLFVVMIANFASYRKGDD